MAIIRLEKLLFLLNKESKIKEIAKNKSFYSIFPSIYCGKSMSDASPVKGRIAVQARSTVLVIE